MATADVTAEEIEDAPLLINPQVKELKPSTRSRLNLALCIVLVINTLLQLIAVVTPAWNVIKGDLSSSYESVYYMIGCIDTTPAENVSTTACTTTTFLSEFSDRYNAAKDTIKPSLVSVYNLRVRYQINIQFGLLIVIGATIFQVIRYIKTNEAYPRVTAINAMLLICTCSTMYQALYEAIVKIDLTLRESEQSQLVVGFPYSVLFYFLAFMQTCACTILVLKQVYDYTCHIEHALFETKVQVDTVQKLYDTEVEEFKHYRQLHSDENRLRGRSRKSHNDRRSQKVTSTRHSVKPKSNSDHLLKHSNNRNDILHRGGHDKKRSRSSRKHDRKERYDINNSAHSGTSRDSSPSNQTDRTREQSQESTEQIHRMDQPCIQEGLTLDLPVSVLEPPQRLNLAQSTTGYIQNPNFNVTSKNDIEMQQSPSEQRNTRKVNDVSEIVTAEVYIPSIDDVEIKD